MIDALKQFRSTLNGMSMSSYSPIAISMKNKNKKKLSHASRMKSV